jgi:hypothetical protein
MRTEAWLLVSVVALAMALAAAGTAKAVTIEFVPPSDPTGSVITMGNNNGYSGGRGIVSEMNSTTILSSVGILHDLRDTTLYFEIAEVVVTSGQVTTGQTILRTGSAVVTTSGLQWIDFPIPSLALVAGHAYHVEFTHFGIGYQNFFYVDNNVRFSQGAFDAIDGTQGGLTGNAVMPAVRFDGEPIPEPSTALLLALGLAGLVALRRRSAVN